MPAWVPQQTVHRDKWRAPPDQTIKWHHRGRINSARVADRSGVTLSKDRKYIGLFGERGALVVYTAVHTEKSGKKNRLQSWKWGSEKIPKAQEVQAETSTLLSFSLVSKCKEK